MIQNYVIRAKNISAVLKMVKILLPSFLFGFKLSQKLL
jgi:hypothetical protein